MPTTGRSAPAAIVRSTAGLTTWYTARRCVADMRVGENAVRISIPRRICADTLHPSTLVSRKRRIPARPPVIIAILTGSVATLPPDPPG